LAFSLVNVAEASFTNDFIVSQTTGTENRSTQVRPAQGPKRFTTPEVGAPRSVEASRLSVQR
jgi:hypothetical protein